MYLFLYVFLKLWKVKFEGIEEQWVEQQSIRPSLQHVPVSADMFQKLEIPIKPDLQPAYVHMNCDLGET